MNGPPSRREFLKSTGLAAVALGGAPAVDSTGSSAHARSQAATPSCDSCEEAPMPLSRDRIVGEIKRRAAWQKRQSRLVVDYYRIYRQLAYPLPVRDLSLPSVPVPSLSSYPWATWMTWTLEERVHTLGWASTWLEDGEARHLVEQDLLALAEWPSYAQYKGPDLSSAHAGRVMWAAATTWAWLGSTARKALETACGRHVDELMPGYEKRYGKIDDKSKVLAAKSPSRLVHNIPLIGTIGAALTASVAGHKARARLNRSVAALFGAVLDLRSDGHGEGVAYDGYVLDFIGDWLEVASRQERASILEHPNLRHYLEESYMLSAPGPAPNVAELSDVEPHEMPFHLSAQAKLNRFKPDPVRAWHLRRCPLGWMRADGLAALHTTLPTSQTKTPPAGALDAQYALVLRSGWRPSDAAVAVSLPRCRMNHLQNDSGTIVVGTKGEWLLADPGYQQYVKGQEREFTIGPKAHNHPVINGHAHGAKAGRLVSLGSDGKDAWKAVVDLTKCYSAKAGVDSAVRTVWLAGKELVVVADAIRASGEATVTYHWHGHRQAAWWVEEGWLLLHLHGTSLWLTSPGCKLSERQIQRLPGSRGQLTLVAETQTTSQPIWWIMAIGEKPPAVERSSGGKGLTAAGRSFKL